MEHSRKASRESALVLVSVALLYVGGTACGTPQWVPAAEPVATVHQTDDLGTADSLAPEVLERAAMPERVKLRRGQSLLGWLSQDVGLDPNMAMSAAATMAEHIDPRRLRAGAELAVYRDSDDLARRMVLPLAGRGELRLSYDATWNGEFRQYQRRVRRHRVAGTVEGGFEGAVTAAGGPALLAYAVADVLQWDLDFNRDLRAGDEFVVVFDAVWMNGQVREIASVEAVRYWSRGEPIEAFRFGDLGYYDREGKPLRKQFLRSPLPYSRVTSRFSNRRFHPVLKVYRPHHGVDYGAPTGTPVRVTANGVVVSAGWNKGGGKTVKVRHANGYLTAYLHLSKFASGVRAGTRVRQGDVIGFVGSTGLSTAPHLDYRVKKDGRWMDPLLLPNEPAAPLSAEQLAEFQRASQLYLMALDGGPDQELAAIAF